MAHVGPDSLGSEEAVARASWAILILSYLTKGRSHAVLTPEDAEEDDDEEWEGDEQQDNRDKRDADAETERNVMLQDVEGRVRSKFLDCLAQLLSPSKDWDGVCATALRECEDHVEVQVARNDGFGLPCLAAGERQMRASGVFEESYSRKLTEYLSPRQASSGEFENLAIEYAAKRLDLWGQRFLELSTKLDTSTTDRKNTCKSLSSIQSWVQLIEHLLSEDCSSSQVRTEVVQRAYECAASTEISQLLDTICPPELGSKLRRALRFIARPILDCRMLRAIAERHPAFRNVRLSLLPPWPKTGNDPKYCVDIIQAWAQLSGRTPSDQEKKALCSFGKRFRRHRRETYSLHAEIQLCVYHEANPHLSPTHPYFGCSRKACLSCEGYLCSFSDPIATRGRHGVLYPAWGVPKATSVEAQRALVLLERDLTTRISRFLGKSNRCGKTDFQPAVPQSSFVTEFSKRAAEEQHKEEQRLAAANKEEEARVERYLRLQGAAMAKGTFERTFEPDGSCAICHEEPGKRCAQCKSIWYCSELCQESDWPSHKLLCKRFAIQSARPSQSHKRAIFFPVDQLQPRMIWMELEHGNDHGVIFESPDLEPYLGKDACVGSTFIEHNPVRGRNLGTLARSGLSLGGNGHVVVLYHRDTFLFDGSAENRSVQTSTAPVGIPPVLWCGPIVALRMTPHQFYEDITMENFRDITDYLSLYGSGEPRESIGLVEGRTSATIRGVRICCEGEEWLHGSDPYVSVDVSRGHPTRLSRGACVAISPISKMLGMPLKLWKYPKDEWVCRDRPGLEDRIAFNNPHAAFLMMETDPQKDDWGWNPRQWSADFGNVLAVRADEQNLAVDDMRAMCHFATYKLQPMFEEALGGGYIQRTKEEVLNFITWENMMAFRDEAGVEMEDKD